MQTQFFRLCFPLRLGRGHGSIGAAVIAIALSMAPPLHAKATESPAFRLPIEQASFHLPRSVVGLASWYGGHHAGHRTANGEIHSTQLRTAAHRTLPLGTVVQVTNLKNGKAVVVRINDRGPYIAGRMIDLSERAARDLAMMHDGLAPVRMQVLATVMKK